MNTLTIILILVIAGLIYFVSRDWKRVAQILGGWSAYELLNFSFDFLFWSYIQYTYGLAGIVFLTFCALVINFLILIWYQKKEIDWLGVGIIEKVKANGHLWVEKVKKHHSFFVRTAFYIPIEFFRVILWALKKNDVFAFFILSVYQDSFITTAFLRHGKFGKLVKKDYFIFISSTIISCIAWSMLIEVMVSVMEFLWRFVS